MSWKKLATTILLQHPRLTVAEDDIELPDGHTSKYMYYANPHNSTMVIAVQGESILLQSEYSYPPDQDMYQFPGGAIEDGEDPIAAGIRELQEESGYITDKNTKTSYLGFFYVDNRRSSAKMHVIVVDSPIDTGKTNFDPEEYIQSEWVTLAKLRQMVRGGEVVNYSLLAGLSMFDNRKTK